METIHENLKVNLYALFVVQYSTALYWIQVLLQFTNWPLIWHHCYFP